MFSSRSSVAVFCVAATCLLLQAGGRAVQAADSPAPPRVFTMDPAALAANKARLKTGDTALKPALGRLLADADKALNSPAERVTDKTKLPPSGDKHDYMSLAPYFWPNPATKDGLPYVRHDGEHNPDADIDANSDARRSNRMCAAVETLSLAYYMTGKEAYASHAAALLRAWFLDPATRMNPNLKYAQAVLGVNDGRGTGIIETARLTALADCSGMLAGSAAWTEADQKGLAEWMRQYLDWLQTSKNGKDEAKATNNHGSWYDVQIATLALFTGQNDLAKKILEDAKTKRIARQIEPDGKMPLELARTRAMGYSTFNLSALEKLASLGERAGVDLWNFQTADGRGIRKAVDFLLPYAADPKKPWPYKQIGKDDRAGLLPIVQEASLHYHDPAYKAAVDAAGRPDASERFHLLMPGS